MYSICLLCNTKMIVFRQAMQCTPILAHRLQRHATLCLSLGDQSQQITACRADCGQKKAPGTYFATDSPKTQGFPNWLMFCLFICICTCVLCIFVSLSYLYFASCILTHISLEMVPRSRDSQIGCCLLPEGPT